MNERNIISMCKQGDRRGQKLLFDAYGKAMLLTCIRYVKNTHDAEELMLNGFFKFFQSIARFEYGGAGTIGAWLKRIMVNECLMFLRRNGDMNLLPEEKAAEVVTEADVLDKMQSDEIMMCIKLLPDGYRAIFNLYVIEGYSHKEIAALLQLSEGTSKSQLSKARQLLQQIIQQKGVIYEKN
jgi:RNA polymerase sigma-70 factor (ECF subfamily)